MSDSDDDPPQLSLSALVALEEFLREREERRILENCPPEKEAISQFAFEENWQLSQFWYDDETRRGLARGALNSTPVDGKIALISCPSIYCKLKTECNERQVTLFEYDQRFEALGKDFILYDYNLPLDVPRDMFHQFDLVIADPPFLSNECLTKMAVTIKFLAKKNIVLCTGAVMAEQAAKLLDVKQCNFVPRHKNYLANEFCCYSNFDFDTKLEEIQ
ncbi:EEF1A lysine methyltransferase 1 [Ooceraea biroi]|uniref:Protein-lysine N-methyltransferase X777_04613 n=1 Tax=Ooceraea biroi TaxID=2015173 RepID=A0A026X5Y1_OOCBI|nr:EEF1A lysine methyltransferase 1 [Ooceraea biroi]EZA62904.1 N(6)-adenine-specific DNA methyltransferase [Ooceraea biroi]